MASSYIPLPTKFYVQLLLKNKNLSDTYSNPSDSSSNFFKKIISHKIALLNSIQIIYLN